MENEKVFVCMKCDAYFAEEMKLYIAVKNYSERHTCAVCGKKAQCVAYEKSGGTTHEY